MSRTLSFPEESVGTVYVMTDNSGDQVPAQGTVEIPDGGRVFLVLDEAAPADLSFLRGVDGDVLTGANLTHVSSQGVAVLTKQTAVRQLAVGELDDAAIGELAAQPSLQVLDVTLVGEAGPGLEAVATSGLLSLQLHGEPGAALTPLARSASLQELHFHARALDVEHLRVLATSTHLEHLDVEVEDVLEPADEEVVTTLVAVASGLKSLGVSRADGSPGLSPAVQVAVLRACPDLQLNGASYTPAAVARLERKLVPA